MICITVFSMLLGIVVALHFDAVVLVAMSQVAMLLLVGSGLVWGMTSWSITLMIANVMLAIYFGVLCVTALPRVVVAIRRALHGK